MGMHVMVVPLYLVFSSFVAPLAALNAEGFALLSFKAAMTEDPELAMANWNSSDADPCSWNGIICKDGNVVSISLPKKGLLGYLPFSLGSLTSLRHVNLRNNRLQGSLPAGLFAARSLQNLVLHANYLSGPLPPEIGNLLFLQILDLSHNSLKSSIPVSLLQCMRLKILDLSHNNFSGSLPAEFGSSFPALQKLSIAYNRLNGSIPRGIGDLYCLRDTADLSHNQFAGAIPASLGNLPENVYIDLSFNNLSGLIPQNGALANGGPTAFVGNPGLCGAPLKNPCSSSSVAASSPATLPNFPRTNHSQSAPEVYHRKSRALNRTVIISIVVGDVVAIGFMATVLIYCYLRAFTWKKREESERSLISHKSAKRCWSCLWKDEPDTMSEIVEQPYLIPLDKQVQFDLDELLKASAFVLDKGGIGIVYRVILDDGLPLAVRRLGSGGLQEFKCFQMKVEAIGKVRHQNIVRLRAYYWSIGEKLLVYDYIPNGNLSTAIHGTVGSSSTPPLRWDIRVKIMKGVAKGLAFLHEFSAKKYIHGCLSPHNILLGLNMEPYISDFGLRHLANVAGFPAMYMHRKADQNSQIPYPDVAFGPISSITFCYQAPEAAMKTAKPSQKWDVYSYGMILLEIISGRSPVVLRDNSNMDLVQWIQIQIGARNPLINILDPFLARKSVRDEEFIKILELALECVQANPERRPSMKHVAESLEMLTSANC